MSDNTKESLKEKIKCLKIKGDKIKKKMDDNVKEINDLVQGPCTPQRELRFKRLMDSTRSLGDELTKITNDITSYTIQLEELS